MTRIAFLPDRAVVAVSGPDRVSFLQGLVSNDVAALRDGEALWAALLTPQGKYVTDFLMLTDGARILLDVARDDAPGLATKLSRFRLRADVSVEATTLAVHAVWNGEEWPASSGAIAARDGRLAAAGHRLLLPAPLADAPDDASDYDRHRLLLGLPDGSRDLEPGRSVLLEGGFDELGGVSWTKGCYMGQELTARTRYRGLLKRRLVPVGSVSAGTLPTAGTILLDEAGREAGTMRSSRDGFGIALLRLERIGETLRTADGAAVRARVPDWMRLAAADVAAADVAAADVADSA